VSNSSIRVSESLMAGLQRAADVEQRNPEEVVEDAVVRYLRLSRRKSPPDTCHNSTPMGLRSVGRIAIIGLHVTAVLRPDPSAAER
jgi:hypothetical protein